MEKEIPDSTKEKNRCFSAWPASFWGLRLFFSTVFSFFAFQFPYFNNYSSKNGTCRTAGAFLFVGKYGFLRFHSGRSPPYSLSFPLKFRLIRRKKRYKRNDGLTEDNRLQNRFTSYLCRSVHNRRIDYFRGKEKPLRIEIMLEDMDYLVTEEQDLFYSSRNMTPCGRR